jgi:hypothetical protein
MSILLLYGYEELVECIAQVEQMMIKVEDLLKVEEDAPLQTNYLISKVCKVKQIKTFNMRYQRPGL